MTIFLPTINHIEPEHQRNPARFLRRRSSLAAVYSQASEELRDAPSGTALTQSTLRIRFDNARNIAEKRALELGDASLALKIRAFQFRDIRPKAASEISLEHASKLPGHSDQEITSKVYRRVGEVVKSTK